MSIAVSICNKAICRRRSRSSFRYDFQKNAPMTTTTMAICPHVYTTLRLTLGSRLYPIWEDSRSYSLRQYVFSLQPQFSELRKKISFCSWGSWGKICNLIWQKKLLIYIFYLPTVGIFTPFKKQNSRRYWCCALYYTVSTFCVCTLRKWFFCVCLFVIFAFRKDIAWTVRYVNVKYQNPNFKGHSEYKSKPLRIAM